MMTVTVPIFVRRLTLVVLLACASTSTMVFAQSPPATPPSEASPPQAAAPPGAPPAVPDTISPAEFNRMFEAYALLQAQNMLRLSDGQYADFIVRLRTLQNARRRHQQARNRLLQDLRRLTNPQNPTSDETSIRLTLDALAREDAAAYDEISKALAQVDEVLDLRQRARFRLLEENLERWKLDLVSRIRRQGRERPTAPKTQPQSK
jgi:hypothetical protein